MSWRMSKILKYIYIYFRYDEDVRSYSNSYFSNGVCIGLTTLKSCLVIAIKVKPTSTLCPRNSKPWFTSKRNESICPPKDMYKNVHSSHSQIAKTWKWLKCPSTGEWINKLWYTYKMDWYLTVRMNKLPIYSIAQMNLRYYTEWSKSN